MTPLPNVDGGNHSVQVMENEPLVNRTSPSGAAPSASSGNQILEPEDLDLYNISDRLKTFENWPISFMSKELLATAGFYYTGRGDAVKCPYCNIEVGFWDQGDIPEVEHEKHSPKCKYIHSRRAALHDRENEPRILRGEDTCGPNGIEGRKSPVLELERMSKEIIAKKLEINTTDEPRHKQFVNYSDRLKSFSSWPETFKIRPESLSEAGFYYTGRNDMNVCYHCGGSLHNWEENDEPWLEHAIWYPNCKFLLSSKGQKFVDEARTKKHERLQRTQEELRTAIETVKELVSGTSSKNVDSEDIINESSSPSEGTSDCEVSICPSSTRSFARTDRDSRMTCLICLDKERDSILLPCYHMVACLNCANKLTKCCVCRETVLYRRRVYIP